MMSDVRLQGHNVQISFHSIDRRAGTNLQDFIRLESNTVHLWGIELDRSLCSLERCAGWLDKVERHQAARFACEDIRQRYILAHGGLRAVLSKYLGVTPDMVSLDRNTTGKPSLTRERHDQSTITFNLSHAHGRALIAVSQAQEVGVDLECVRSGVEVAKLSERYFSRAEHTAIMQAPEEQRATRFFRYWVAKEAVLKAQGIGLRGLSNCEIFLEAEGINTEVRARLGAQSPDTLQVRLLSCEKGWEAAVAAQRLDSVKQCYLGQQ